jgi:hypothetical protein
VTKREGPRPSTMSSSQASGFDLETDYDYRVVRPEALNPVTTLGRGSYGKVVLASINENGQEILVAVKVVAKSRLKGRSHVEKAVSELNVMSQVQSRFLLRSIGSFRAFCSVETQKRITTNIYRTQKRMMPCTLLCPTTLGASSSSTSNGWGGSANHVPES